MPNVMLRNDAAEGIPGRDHRRRPRPSAEGPRRRVRGHRQRRRPGLYHQLGGFYPGDKFKNALFLNPGQGSGGSASDGKSARESRNHFVTITLHGTRTNAAGYGARITVTVTTPDGPRRDPPRGGFGQQLRRLPVPPGNRPGRRDRYRRDPHRLAGLRHEPAARGRPPRHVHRGDGGRGGVPPSPEIGNRSVGCVQRTVSPDRGRLSAPSAPMKASRRDRRAACPRPRYPQERIGS